MSSWPCLQLIPNPNESALSVPKLFSHSLLWGRGELGQWGTKTVTLAGWGSGTESDHHRSLELERTQAQPSPTDLENQLQGPQEVAAEQLWRRLLTASVGRLFHLCRSCYRKFFHHKMKYGHLQYTLVFFCPSFCGCEKPSGLPWTCLVPPSQSSQTYSQVSISAAWEAHAQLVVNNYKSCFNLVLPSHSSPINFYIFSSLTGINLDFSLLEYVFFL